jgi:small subunit ribosomal protein S6
MRRYETFVIIDPDLSEEQRSPLIGRTEELIAQMDGFLIDTDDWGERKLAYDIKKKQRGYYVRFDYCGMAALVNEIERFYRIDDRALKYMTVLLNADADLEKIKEDKAAKESAAADDSSDPGKAPEEDQEKEPEAPQEKAKTDVDVPASETEESAAQKTPSSTIEEA